MSKKMDRLVCDVMFCSETATHTVEFESAAGGTVTALRCEGRLGRNVNGNMVPRPIAVSTTDRG